MKQWLLIGLFSTILFYKISAQQGVIISKNWVHVSTANSQLPKPWKAWQQTATQIIDIDKDGINDFVLGCRVEPPVLIWYRRNTKGWQRYVIEKELKTIEAGGAYTDIDGDGDIDLVYGQDWQGTEVWWWENPYPNFQPEKPWVRHLIKTGGKTQHHDQVFGDFKQLGLPQLVFWNQGTGTIYLATIPDNPKMAKDWTIEAIFSGNAGSQKSWYPEGLAATDVDGDGYTDLLAGNGWFKYKNGKFVFIPVAEIGGRIAAGKFKPGKIMQIVTAPGDGSGPVRWYDCTGNPEDSTAWTGHDLLNRELIHGHTLDLADIDGDGNLDIYVAEMAKWTEEDRNKTDNPNATAFIFYGDGKGNFSTTELVKGMDFHESKIGDLDGDGDADVLSKPYIWKTPRVDIFLQKGTGQAQPSLQTIRNKYGLEIYSLRDSLKKNVTGSLQKMKQLGFTELEVSGYYGLTAQQFKKEMDRLGLKCTSMLFDYKRYETALDSIIMEAKLFGAKYVGFAWIPHEGGFKKADAEKAIAFMNSNGEKLKAAGLKLFYHLHGYEFLPEAGETLFDLMAKQTQPGSMYFQLDVFWVTRGGADPSLLLQKYPGRFCSLHVKDIGWGVATGDYTGGAPDETSVAIGKGQVNWVKLLRAAIKNGVQQYFIEDEAPEVLKQIPQSMQYLKSLK